jgi:thiamine pyrophosphate-dependent acetolactate synthase large subunit-like protein
VVLAGPGVVLDDAVPGLHALAAAGSLGVLNTWGAKGVFDWRSRHHLATVGLQARDFELGGLAEADLIIATGVDEREALAAWRLAPVVEVAPSALDPLADVWGRARTDITVPPLRAELARVTQAGWEVSTAPLPPTRVTRAYSAFFGGGGLVAADPGTAGYWVARTFGTSGVGGAQVPADADAVGFAVACALVARLLDPTRAVLAVVDAIVEVHERLLDLAAAHGVAVPVEVWSDDGEALDADAHGERLRDLVAVGGRATLATDARQIAEMLEVAGPIVAWTAAP